MQETKNPAKKRKVEILDTKSVNDKTEIENNISHEGSNDKGGLFFNLSFYFLALLTFLMPFFLVPSLFVTNEFSKMWLVFSLGSVALITFLIGTIQRGELYVPKSLLFAGFSLFAIIAMLRAVFHGAWKMSLLGYGMETYTGLAILFVALILYMVFVLTDSPRRIKTLVFAVLGGSIIVLGLQILKYALLFVGGPLTKITGELSSRFSYFGFRDVTNAIGSSSDFAVFAFIISIFALIGVESKVGGASRRIILSLLFFVSLIFMLLFGFPALYVLSGLTYLMLFVGIFSFFRNGNSLNMRVGTSFFALIALIASALFVIDPALPIKTLEIVKVASISPITPPDISETYNIAKGVFTSPSAVFGVGPNMFSSAWNELKSADYNFNPAWAISFSSGGSFLLTSIINLGLVGLIAFAIILFGIFKIFSAIYKNSREMPAYPKMLSISAFVSAFVGILALAIYPPQTAVVPIVIISLIGLALAVLKHEGVVKEHKWSFAKSPIASFASVLAIIIFLVGVGYVAYTSTAKTYASSLLRKTQISGYYNNNDEVGLALVDASRWGKSDLYYRAIAVHYLLRAQNINSEAMDENARNRALVSYVDSAIQNMYLATKYNKYNYENHAVVGRINALLVPGLPEGYSRAKTAYEKALALNPENPELYRQLAELEAARGDIASANQYIVQSINKKRNYSKSYITMSLLEASRGNRDGAIAILENTRSFMPAEMAIVYQLGLYYRDAGEHTKAAAAFQTIINVIPEHSDARFALALIYEKQGRITAAINELNKVLEYNPNNPVVLSALARLKTPPPAPSTKK